MPSLKVPFKVYLSPEIVKALQAKHPGYGEAGRVVKELIEAYVLRKVAEPINWKQVAADEIASKHHG